MDRVDEMHRHAPGLAVLKYYGSNLKKTLVALQAYDVLVTTYGIVSSRVLKVRTRIEEDDDLIVKRMIMWI
jgi:hypothetical protein